MNFIPKNMLVTGGAGFIGANFIAHMLRKYGNIRVHNIDKLTYAGSRANMTEFFASPRHTFHQIDICDQTLIENLLIKHNIDTIVHFAAESHVDRSIVGPAIFIQTNVLGTFSLLEAARKVWLDINRWNFSQCRFHHISTDEVYGTLKKTDPAFTETTPYAPNSPYSASKASSDHLVRAYYHTYDLPVTISNCSNNYGPLQHQEKLIPTIIRCCLENKPIPIYGNGSNIRDWLYVDDHCEAIELIINKGALGESYNIGSNEEHSNLDIVNMICGVLAKLNHCNVEKYTQLISFVKDRPGHDWRYAINFEKITRELHWLPSVSFITGVTKTINFYQNLLFIKPAEKLNHVN